MAGGYMLVLAILILGGIVATLGDRIGTKVGKSRLSIFNLRPRNTATLVTILTGASIAASTFGILLATNSELRKGIFEYERIQAELQNAKAEKQKVEEELRNANTKSKEAQDRLDLINKFLSTAVNRQAETQAKLQSVQAKFQQANNELAKVQLQEQQLRDRVQGLSSERDNLLAQSNKLKQERDRLATEREVLSRQASESQVVIATLGEQRIKLEKDVTKLGSEIKELETSKEILSKNIEAFRLGNVAINSEQVLASTVIRPGLSLQESKEAVYALLQRAELQARNLLYLPTKGNMGDAVIEVKQSDIDSMIESIKGGGSYVMRILSTRNYLRRENKVSIAVDVIPNKKIFSKGEVIASLQFKPNLQPQEIAERVSRLFSLVRFRANSKEILADPITGNVGTFPTDAISDLLQTIGQYKTSFEVRAVAKESIFVSGPLSLELVVVTNGVEIKRFS
jgi:uncharacterized protein (DUF3084 family)